MRSLDVGARAPDLEILEQTRRPRVLAFVRDWSATTYTRPELDRVRAQLRGLGAELIVVSARGAWSIRADNAPRALAEATGEPDEPAEPSRQLAERFAATAKRYGVGRDRDAVFVIGGDGVIRFSHVLAAPLGDSLATALAAAVDAMLGRRTPPVTFTRREWATSCLVAGFAFALFANCRSSDHPDDQPKPPEPAPPPPIAELEIVLDVNGARHALTIDPRTSLLDALRERLGLTGTKKGCDGGQCGACTVHVGGQRVVSCLTLAAVVEGQPIKTIEGLGTVTALHPMQAAFVAHDAFQCGFCTPGQIMSAVALLDENRAHTDDEVREQMSGNLCRCGAYPNIIAAVRAARRA